MAAKTHLKNSFLSTESPKPNLLNSSRPDGKEQSFHATNKDNKLQSIWQRLSKTKMETSPRIDRGEQVEGLATPFDTQSQHETLKFTSNLFQRKYINRSADFGKRTHTVLPSQGNILGDASKK